MMEESQRMTINRADNIAAKYDVRIGQGSFTPGEIYSCCGLGLYMLEKQGDVSKSEAINNSLEFFRALGRNDTHNHMSFCSKDRTKYMATAIAKEVGVPVSYAFGLNNGFEDDYNSIIVEGEQDDDYLTGLEDGKALAKLAGLE